MLKPGAGIVEMVYIPAGTFQMGANDGDSDEKPVQSVSVAPFFMSQFVITQAQWRVVAALPKVNRDLEGEPWSGLDPQFVGDQLPVVNVSWYSALEFCQRLSKASGRIYGLPSEAQWDYACRAGTTTKYSFGNEITQDKANYGNRERITPSGNYPPNGFGLYDLHGNVWE